MNRSHNLLLLTIVFIVAIIGCSDDNKSSGMAPKYAAIQPEKHLATT